MGGQSDKDWLLASVLVCSFFQGKSLVQEWGFKQRGPWREAEASKLKKKFNNRKVDNTSKNDRRGIMKRGSLCWWFGLALIVLVGRGRIEARDWSLICVECALCMHRAQITEHFVLAQLQSV